jgi:lipopolysaccharide/colanic/teichoic acid biosynthesis glycosyltransferase
MTISTVVAARRRRPGPPRRGDADVVEFVFDPRELPDRSVRWRKRVFDLAVGSVLALLAVPVIAVLAVFSACALRCNPFFVQRRPGVGETEFRLVKLRTLPRSFPRQALKPEISGCAIPRFGSWLRRTHLDELPQLFQVVTGRMSLVGPRPRLCDAVEPVDPGYDRLRRAVAPGCSGLWQVSIVGDGTATGGPAYDLFYLRHASVRLDLWILLRTAGLILGLAPRVDLDDVPRWAQRRRTPMAAVYPVEPLLAVVTEDVA